MQFSSFKLFFLMTFMVLQKTSAGPLFIHFMNNNKILDLINDNRTNENPETMCSNPSNFNHLVKEYNYTSYPLPIALEDSMTIQDFVNKTKNYGMKTCNNFESSNNMHLPNEERALCPWTWYIDTSENRLPKHLLLAKCKCKNSFCSTTGNKCLPVFRQIQILQKTKCIDKIWQWESKWISVSFACLCVAPLTRLTESFQSIN